MFSLLIDHHLSLAHCYVLSFQNNFSGEEHTVYINLLSQLRKTYAELLSLSNKRVSDLHSLLDFLQAATQELIWLNEKEEQELNRDWANKSLNISDVERYYEVSRACLNKFCKIYVHVHNLCMVSSCSLIIFSSGSIGASIM